MNQLCEVTCSASGIEYTFDMDQAQEIYEKLSMLLGSPEIRVIPQAHSIQKVKRIYKVGAYRKEEAELIVEATSVYDATAIAKEVVEYLDSEDITSTEWEVTPIEMADYKEAVEAKIEAMTSGNFYTQDDVFSSYNATTEYTNSRKL